MKRKMFALLGAVAVAGAVYASAASLSVSATSLGEGTSTVTSCNGATGVATSFNTSYSSTAGEFVVDSVNVDHINAACDGKTISVVLANGSNTSIGTGSATVVAPVDDSSQTITVSPTPVTSAVVKTIVQING